MSGPSRVVAAGELDGDTWDAVYEWHLGDDEYVECEVRGTCLEWMRREADGKYTHASIEFDAASLPLAEAALARLDARKGEDIEAWSKRLAKELCADSPTAS